MISIDFGTLARPGVTAFYTSVSGSEEFSSSQKQSSSQMQNKSDLPRTALNEFVCSSFVTAFESVIVDLVEPMTSACSAELPGNTR
jgi:hypothetical protein